MGGGERRGPHREGRPRQGVGLGRWAQSGTMKGLLGDEVLPRLGRETTRGLVETMQWRRGGEGGGRGGEAMTAFVGRAP